MLDHKPVKLKRSYLTAYLKLTDLRKCHIYIPGTLDTFLTRTEEGVWLMEYEQPQVMRLTQSEQTDIYEAVDKFAEAALAYDINKLMLS